MRRLPPPWPSPPVGPRPAIGPEAPAGLCLAVPPHGGLAGCAQLVGWVGPHLLQLQLPAEAEAEAGVRRPARLWARPAGRHIDSPAAQPVAQRGSGFADGLVGGDGGHVAPPGS